MPTPKNPWLLSGLLILALTGFYLAASRTQALPAYIRIPGPHPSPAATRPDRLRQDLDYLDHQLPRLHRNAFHSVSRDDFEAAVDELARDAPDMSEFEFAVGVMRVVALIGDAHTEAIPPPSVELLQCPVRLEWFKDGLYVTAAAASCQDLVGARLVEVGELELEAAMRSVAAVIAHENRPGLEKRAPRALLNPQLLAALGAQDDPEVGHYLFELADGTRVSRELEPVEYDEYLAIWESRPRAGDGPLFERRGDDAYWFETLEDSGAVYFRYRRCAQMASLGFGQFTDELFDALDREESPLLIVDMRDNGVGISGVLQRFPRRARGPLSRSG